MSPRTVAILAGGLNHEREVSLRSGRRMSAILADGGCHVRLLDVDSTLLQRLNAINPDVVWPLIHGTTGEDGSLQDLLDLTGLPYVGATARGARLSFQKPVAGAILSNGGCPVPESTCLPQSLFREVGATSILELVSTKYGFPVVIKPAAGGSALGVNIVNDPKDLPGAMVDSFAYGDQVLIEQFIEGREVAVSVIESEDGPCALPPVEIVTEGAYDYDARYNPGRCEYFVPARLDSEVLEECKRLAITAHEALGLRHLSRADIIVDGEGTPWFIDINIAPGMTETSLFPQAAQAYAQEQGVPVHEIYGALIEAAVAEHAGTEKAD